MCEHREREREMYKYIHIYYIAHNINTSMLMNLMIPNRLDPLNYIMGLEKDWVGRRFLRYSCRWSALTIFRDEISKKIQYIL